MQRLWELAKKRLTTEEIKNEMLLRTDGEGRSAWHIAAFRGEVDVMQEIWKLAKRRLTTEEIENEILLRTDGEGRNAWQIAALRGKVDLMQKVRELAKERLTTEEIKKEMFYALTNEDTIYVGQKATQDGTLDMLQKT